MIHCELTHHLILPRLKVYVYYGLEELSNFISVHKQGERSPCAPIEQRDLSPFTHEAGHYGCSVQAERLEHRLMNLIGVQVDRLGAKEMGTDALEANTCTVNGVVRKDCNFLVKDADGNHMFVDTGDSGGTDCMFEGTCTGFMGKTLQHNDQLTLQGFVRSRRSSAAWIDPSCHGESRPCNYTHGGYYVFLVNKNGILAWHNPSPPPPSMPPPSPPTFEGSGSQLGSDAMLVIIGGIIGGVLLLTGIALAGVRRWVRHGIRDGKVFVGGLTGEIQRQIQREAEHTREENRKGFERLTAVVKAETQRILNQLDERLNRVISAIDKVEERLVHSVDGGNRHVLDQMRRVTRSRGMVAQARLELQAPLSERRYLEMIGCDKKEVRREDMEDALTYLEVYSSNTQVREVLGRYEKLWVETPGVQSQSVMLAGDFRRLMAELLPLSAAAVDRRAVIQQELHRLLAEEERLMLERLSADGDDSSGDMREILFRFRQLQPTPTDAHRSDTMERVLETMMVKLDELGDKFGRLEAATEARNADGHATRLQLQGLHRKVDKILTGENTMVFRYFLLVPVPQGEGWFGKALAALHPASWFARPMLLVPLCHDDVGGLRAAPVCCTSSAPLPGFEVATPRGFVGEYPRLCQMGCMAVRAALKYGGGALGLPLPAGSLEGLDEQTSALLDATMAIATEALGAGRNDGRSTDNESDGDGEDASSDSDRRDAAKNLLDSATNTLDPAEQLEALIGKGEHEWHSATKEITLSEYKKIAKWLETHHPGWEQRCGLVYDPVELKWKPALNRKDRRLNAGSAHDTSSQSARSSPLRSLGGLKKAHRRWRDPLMAVAVAEPTTSTALVRPTTPAHTRTRVPDTSAV